MADSAVWVPVVAMSIPIVAIVSNAITRVQSERARTEQRRDMLARGIPLAEIEQVMARRAAQDDRGARGPSGPVRTVAAMRTTAIVLIFTGISLALFFLALGVVLQQRGVYAGVPAGILPLGVGLGFWVDYQARAKELARMRENGEL
jgi:hypothetical protein